MSRMAAADKHGFEVSGVTEALRKSDHAKVAKKGDLEVWATKYLAGQPGDRHYRVRFSALRVLKSTETGRKVEAVVLPDNRQSDLVKVLAYLATVKPDRSTTVDPYENYNDGPASQDPAWVLVPSVGKLNP